MRVLKFNCLFIGLFLFPILSLMGQESTNLILTGENSWIFHTPDDGRTSLHIAPRINDDWDWSLYQLDSDGMMYTKGLKTNDIAVNGNVKAKEIKVTTSAIDWPDYVFEDDYRLSSLTETALFIEKNKHLPGVPKAAVIEQHGMSLGEMNKILLKKIEELTLHLIEKDKKIAKQDEILSNVLERLKKLEK
ncbi:MULTISPECIES: hypothetical protein [Sphingobacterium]|uniref:hypothetical protein n=1 Tax=Sphingobacterium TaxID=28453 RepID=UPI00257C3697|nr:MULTISPECIES: hypothetical protein [Sphingobacterium]